MSNPYYQEPKITELPEPPKVFGEDGGHFYRYYDALADELDEDTVKSLKSQLDGILIFAGLFAGVNTAFLALTLPQMSADPADDTNALLLQLVKGGNSTIHSANDLPSYSFTPAAGMLHVNLLFSVSLTLAIISSFLAVLGQQWLVYYRKRSGGGVEAQRWDQLRRYLGAKRWRMELVLDDVLPALLQLALIIFSIALAIYLKTLNGPVFYSILGLLAVALLILILMGVAVTWDKWCPFTSPLVRLCHAIISYLSFHLRIFSLRGGPITGPSISTTFETAITHSLGVFFARAPSIVHDTVKFLERMMSELAVEVTSKLKIRSSEVTVNLQVAAVRRVLVASEDHNTLLYAALNIRGIDSKAGALFLLSDTHVFDRITGTMRLGETDLSAFAFAGAFTHLLWIGGNAEMLITPWLRPSQRLPILSSDLESHISTNVSIISKLLNTPAVSGHSDIAPYHVFIELSTIIIARNPSTQDILRWFAKVQRLYPRGKSCPPKVMGLVAWAVMQVNDPMVLDDEPMALDNSAWLKSKLRIFQSLLDLDLCRLAVQRPLPRPSMFKLVCDSLKDPSFSTVDLKYVYVWLLESASALALSKKTFLDHEYALVGERAVTMLLALDSKTIAGEGLGPISEIDMESQLSCTEILRQSFDWLVSHKKFYLLPASFLTQVVDHLSQVRRNIRHFPKIHQLLSIWLSIPEILEEGSRLMSHDGEPDDKVEEYKTALVPLRIAFDEIVSQAQSLDIRIPLLRREKEDTNQADPLAVDAESDLRWSGIISSDPCGCFGVESLREVTLGREPLQIEEIQHNDLSSATGMKSELTAASTSLTDPDTSQIPRSSAQAEPLGAASSESIPPQDEGEGPGDSSSPNVIDPDAKRHLDQETLGQDHLDLRVQDESTHQSSNSNSD